MKFKINNINKLMFKINECCMNIENTNLHNILSTLIFNQASLYSKVSGNLNDIFYVETFDSEPSVSGLYIDHNGESRYWTGIEWEYISNEVSDIIDVNSTSGTVPTSKAVYDFVISSLNEFTPSTDTSVREIYYLSGTEFEEQPAVCHDLCDAAALRLPETGQTGRPDGGHFPGLLRDPVHWLRDRLSHFQGFPGP